MIIGAQGEERITAEEVARRLDTINYEITCGSRPGPARSAAASHERPPRSLVRDALAGSAPGWSAAPSAIACSAARWSISISSSTATSARPPSGSPAPLGGPIVPPLQAFGAWRVLAADRSLQADLTPLRGGDLGADLELRDFTVNAIAEPLAGGEPVDPTGGRADLAARRLRMAAPNAFADDPLRVLRTGRLGAGARLRDPDPATVGRRATPPRSSAQVAGERVFEELKRMLAADRALEGIGWPADVGALDAVLPEIAELARRGAEPLPRPRRPRPHARGAGEVIEIERRPGAVLGSEHGRRVRRTARRAAGGRADARDGLRLGALLHDARSRRTPSCARRAAAGSPATTARAPRSRATILTRLRASERLAPRRRAHAPPPAPRLPRAPASRSTRGRSTRTSRRPSRWSVDVTLLVLADRLATRGRKRDEAIERARRASSTSCSPEVLGWRESRRPPAALMRGDALAGALGDRPGAGGRATARRALGGAVRRGGYERGSGGGVRRSLGRCGRSAASRTISTAAATVS